MGIRELDENIKELKELTDTLTGFNPGMYSSKKSLMEVTHGAGKIKAVALIHKDNIWVGDCIAEVGASMDEHSHDEETEIFAVYKGVYEITMPHGVVVLRSGDSFTIKPGVPHSTYCPEACEHITMIIPAPDDFPRASQMENTDEWERWQKHVLITIESLADTQKEIEKAIHELEIRLLDKCGQVERSIGEIKVAAVTLGAVAGLIISVLSFVVKAIAG